MNTTIETIGPAYAEILLKRNTQNRPMQPHHVTYLVREMESARWMENGEPIIIGEDGLIKDGQHRLMAIIRSGKSYKFVIVRDVASNVFATINCGKGRNAADALAIIGEKNSKLIANSLNWLNKYYSGQLKTGDRKQKASPTLILELLSIYPDVNDTAEKRWRIFGYHGVLNACRVIFSRISEQDSELFFERLITGVNISISDPEYLLRERLIANKGSKQKYTSRYTFAVTIKAWNLRRTGRIIRQLKFNEIGENQEDFPIAI